jgi:hypothetical protein
MFTRRAVKYSNSTGNLREYVHGVTYVCTQEEKETTNSLLHFRLSLILKQSYRYHPSSISSLLLNCPRPLAVVSILDQETPAEAGRSVG